MINGKYEDRLCGLGPGLQFYLDEDIQLQELKRDIFQEIYDSYDAVNVYIQRFEKIREFYVEDFNMEESTITEERGIILKSFKIIYYNKLSNRTGTI